MGLAEDVQTMWTIGEGLKQRGFRETLCIQFFGPLTEAEKEKAWSLYQQNETVEDTIDISKKLNKDPWLIHGYVCTRKYHIEQPDPGKRLSEIPVERGQELALKVAKAAKNRFSSKDFYINDSVENLDTVFKVIENSNYTLDKEDYRILGAFEYMMHVAQRMITLGKYDDDEICNITGILHEDIERIKENLHEE